MKSALSSGVCPIMYKLQNTKQSENRIVGVYDSTDTLVRNDVPCADGAFMSTGYRGQHKILYFKETF